MCLENLEMIHILVYEYEKEGSKKNVKWHSFANCLICNVWESKVSHEGAKSSI